MTFCGSGHCFLNGKFDDLSGNTCTRFRGVPAATLFLERGCYFLSIRWPDRGKRKAENVSNILLLSLFFKKRERRGCSLFRRVTEELSHRERVLRVVQRDLFQQSSGPAARLPTKGLQQSLWETEKTRKGFFSNSWCFELRSSARTTSPFLWSDPGRRHKRLRTQRRTKLLEKIPAKGDSEARNSLFVLFKLLFYSYLSNKCFYLSQSTTACQCFFSPLTDKSGGLLRFS